MIAKCGAERRLIKMTNNLFKNNLAPSDRTTHIYSGSDSPAEPKKMASPWQRKMANIGDNTGEFGILNVHVFSSRDQGKNYFYNSINNCNINKKYK